MADQDWKTLAAAMASGRTEKPTLPYQPVDAHFPPQTPDDAFRKPMRFLSITSIILGGLYSLAALGGLAKFFQGGIGAVIVALQPRDLIPLILPAAALLVSLLLLAAGIWGASGKRADRALLTAALFMGLLQTSRAAIAVCDDSLRWEDLPSLVPVASVLIFWLAFPAMCIEGVMAMWKSRKANVIVDPRSSWTPLARAIALTAILGGLLLTFQYGRLLINASLHPALELSQLNPSAQRELWWGWAIAMMFSLTLIGGGCIAISSPRSSRIFIVSGTIGIFGCLLFRVIRYQIIPSRSPVGNDFAEIEPIVFFLIFAIVVLRDRTDARSITTHSADSIATES